MSGEDDCPTCGEDLSGGTSHYHCPRCSAVTSMFGHATDAECNPAGRPYDRSAVLAELSATTTLPLDHIEAVLNAIDEIGIEPRDWRP